MKHLQHIGNDFSKVNVTKSIKLFPVHDSGRNLWQVDIMFMCYDPKAFVNSHSTNSFVTSGKLSDIEILVGSDVYSIQVLCRSQSLSSAFPTQERHQCNIRIDRLIMLNMISRLLKIKP